MPQMIAAVISMPNKCIITLFRKNASLFLQDFLHFKNRVFQPFLSIFPIQFLQNYLKKSQKPCVFI